MFERLVHSDWSVDARKRWCASARRAAGHWRVSCPRRVPPLEQFVDELFDGRVLAGFDFPIGLPAAYGARTGFESFREALNAFGSGPWHQFFEVADDPAQISLHRPFYPRRSTTGAKQPHLLAAHGVAALDALHRRCERATAERRAASTLFWTLGGNQVGKAALTGWRGVIRPALARGARLWPFDGTLAALAATGGCVLCETYPGEAYGHVGARFRSGESKRRQADRRAKAEAIIAWTGRHGVIFEAAARAAILDGFGPSNSGEDPFDALIGLLGMIEVVEGRRTPGPEQDDEIRRWEGWILGQQL
ncbi:DUF429 domain-containing protein [Oleomonas cavernae]|uniref:DUF429 domain-containing protein n=1 Tax=Oleomonas cavernae TaxID=2320859 RepID=A0A418WB92_9PROT|nr:DUF429 domain-containing protein [Oleomonas cavernae]RJF87244.1 DUF429 domain-containing protein [Oleomonas cavernae]